MDEQRGATAPAQVQNTLTARLRAASLHMSQTPENATTRQSVSKTHGGDWIKATWIWSDAYFRNFYHLCFSEMTSFKKHPYKVNALLLDLCTWHDFVSAVTATKTEDELTREQLKVGIQSYGGAHFSLDTYHTMPICFGAQHCDPPDSTSTQKQPHE